MNKQSNIILVSWEYNRDVNDSLFVILKFRTDI